MEWKTNFITFLLIVLCSITVVEANWCTRSRSELMQHQVTVTQKCNQTYEASCSFFSWDTCTFNELVDCPVKKNITLTRYFIVEVCCPGFKLDPINNVTCIPTSVSIESSSEGLFNSVVTVSGIENDSINGTEAESENFSSPTPGREYVTDDGGTIQSPPKPPKEWYKQPVTVSEVEKGRSASKTESDNNVSSTSSSSEDENDDGDDGDHSIDGQTGHAVDDDDDIMLFGLSYGAYAGIICTLLFILCVFILIMLHVRKRSRKNLAKGKQSSNTSEIEMTQKMLNVPA